jgi:paraquat-inducible protein A
MGICWQTSPKLQAARLPLASGPGKRAAPERPSLTQANQIFSGVADLIEFNFLPLAALIFFTTMLAPLAKILVTLYAVSSALAGRRFPGVAAAMRAAEVLSTWSMLEVYLLAVIVAVVKLSMMATVDLRIGSYAFFALILVSTWANSALETEAVWSRLEKSP